MSWRRAYLIFLAAFAVAATANIEKICQWTEERLGGSGSLAPALAALRAADKGSGLRAASLAVDCALSPLFHESYKTSLACARDSDPAASLAGLAGEPLPANQALDVARLGIESPSPEIAAVSASGPAPEAVEPLAMEPLAMEPSAGEKPSSTPKRPDTLTPPLVILVVGDSLAIGLSTSMRRYVAHASGVTLIDEGKVSTGLANPNYFDWEKGVRVFLTKHKPGMVVIMMGANDARYLDPAKPLSPGKGGRSWPEVLAQRVRTFLAILAEENIPSYWIGLPVMGEEHFNRQAAVMNAIIQEASLEFADVHFIETRHVLADPSGAYCAFKAAEGGGKVKIRASDRIHFTPEGGNILAEHFFHQVASRLRLILAPLGEAGAGDSRG